MSEKEIEIIRKQIDKLNDKDFDLNIWKSSAIMIMERIFGRDSEKINLIRNINYDYSSWTLRDTSGASASEVVKKLGRELLETAIQELEVFGIPEKKETSQVEATVITSALEDALRVSQYREIIALIGEKTSQAERKKKLNEKLQTFGDETVREVLAGILSNPALEGLK
jgi:hypothetical protein